jgi:hypothetical protein
VFVGRYVNKLEVEKEDGSDPSIDRRVGLNVGVTEHAFNKLSVHLNHQIANTDQIQLESSERTKQTVELKFHLRVMRFVLVPRYRTETRRAMLAISTVLRKNPPDAAIG